jgi:Fe-S-cluster containining protein
MLQLSPGEAVILLSALRNLPLQAQKEIVDRALKHQTKTDQFVFISGELATAYQHSCPLLNEDGQCSVYSARPLICRIYGLPVKQPIIRGTEYEGTQHRGHYSLACPKNRTSFKAEITYGERDHFTPNWAHRWLRAIKDAEVVQRKDALVSVPPKGKKTGVQVNLAIVLQELQNSEHYPRSSG